MSGNIGCDECSDTRICVACDGRSNDCEWCGGSGACPQCVQCSECSDSRVCVECDGAGAFGPDTLGPDDGRLDDGTPCTHCGGTGDCPRCVK